MKELLEILRAAEAGRTRGEAMALATIVGVRGSTYRREGARLLVGAGGSLTGNISGGCLEGDVQVVAGEVLAEGRPRLVTYDLTADDDLVWGLGLGCNGAIDVFVEPLDARGLAGLAAVRDLAAAERTAALVTVLAPAEAAGTRLTVYPDGTLEGALPAAGAADRVRRTALAVLAEGQSRRTTVEGDAGLLDLFVEVVRPPVRLVVCGAGHDATPLVARAVELGWRVVVVDRREAFLTSERFPGARFLQVPFREAGAALPADERTAVVVMTHNYLHDRDVLRGLLTRPAPYPFYVGLLGPRLRTEKMLAELAAEGVTVPPALAPRLFAPVGLDIGSEGPDEIALAAVAEIIAAERGRPGGFLRERRAPIHAPTPS
ncbi:MAG: XdhC family protein [Armatimonadota bacterium]|nr:XdhC family protein [Armatimonadota bacterium]MDR7459348.1 XdhC family protein [Armatimonadota bacterium]MDR7479456.1 XdhC family protein [Armatimonadota bacterium]MDR7491238.1 XdhC family protein [Armatimonadota bacterium]MDR7501628.1 XdhC family protein [Armatimonadota bacterium]